MRTTLLALLASLAMTSNAFAAECVDAAGNDISHDAEQFHAVIEAKDNCYGAAEMARACGWGSSIDVLTVDIAYGICEKELQAEKPKASDLALLKTMENRCMERYENEEGTMYRSFNAYCHLAALEWILSISRK